MKIGMKFEGGAELAKLLDQLSVRTSANVMRAALKEGGEAIRAHAASIAPRAPGAPDIADNIGISTANPRGEAAAVKIGPTKGFAYGLPQEFGTVHHGAQPFMRPAFDAKAGAALNLIGLAIWRALLQKGIGSARTAPGITQGGPTISTPSVISGGGGLL